MYYIGNSTWYNPDNGSFEEQFFIIDENEFDQHWLGNINTVFEEHGTVEQLLEAFDTFEEAETGLRDLSYWGE